MICSKTSFYNPSGVEEIRACSSTIFTLKLNSALLETSLLICTEI